MGGNKNISYDERSSTRLIYDDDFQVIEIREFAGDAKIGSPVTSLHLKYDNDFQVINLYHGNDLTDNKDILVPEQPIIISTVPPSPNISKTPIVNGIIGTGDADEIVKDDDIIRILHAESRVSLGQGLVSSNSFAIVIDLNNYNSGDKIPLVAQAFNERNTKINPGTGSKLSKEFIYEIL